MTVEIEETGTRKVEVTPGFYKTWLDTMVAVTPEKIIVIRHSGSRSALIISDNITPISVKGADLHKPTIAITAGEFITAYNKAREIQNEAFAQCIKNMQLIETTPA